MLLRRATRAGLVALTVCAVGCSAVVRANPYSVSHVRAVFGSHGFKAEQVFDASKEGDAQINATAGLNSRYAAVNAAERASLHELRAEHTSFVLFRSGSPDGALFVVVAPSPHIATLYARNMRRSLAKEHARYLADLKKMRASGGTVTGGGWIGERIQVRGNVASNYPGSVKAPVARRLHLAMAAL